MFHFLVKKSFPTLPAVSFPTMAAGRGKPYKRSIATIPQLPHTPIGVWECGVWVWGNWLGINKRIILIAFDFVFSYQVSDCSNCISASMLFFAMRKGANKISLKGILVNFNVSGFSS